LLDRRLLAVAARRRSPVANQALLAASRAANRSLLWLAIAGLLTATGRRRARSAAAGGLMGIGIASSLVNGPLKYAWRRDRPPIVTHGGGEALLPLPRTFSFPSGHSASAFAFAAGATAALPPTGAVLGPLAGAVAYSRVHTGVHYPSDVVVGAGIGAASGIAGERIVRSLRARSVHHVEAPALDVAVPRRAVLIVSDGSGAADDLAAARAVLEDGGVRIADVIAVEDVDQLAARLRETTAPPLVIAAGGDGTVGAAVNAVDGTGALLGVIPLGTSNDVARSLGIPPDAREAAAVIVDGGRVCAVDAGHLVIEGEQRGRTFLNAATAGLNVAFAEAATSGSVRDKFGGLTYPIAAARALRGYEPFECTIEHDGTARTMRVVHLSVSNAPIFGGVLGMRVPGASLTDGMLELIVVERLSLFRLLVALAGTAVGRHHLVHGVHGERVRSVRIEASSPQDVALDGEVIGRLPAHFEVRPAAVRVVVPPEPGSAA
jgi:undecaprenyl-diphosphatase